MNKRLIVAITGASGTIYGIRILESLKSLGVESHLVMSDSAKLTMAAETNYKPAQIEAMADVVIRQKMLVPPSLQAHLKVLAWSLLHVQLERCRRLLAA